MVYIFAVFTEPCENHAYILAVISLRTILLVHRKWCFRIISKEICNFSNISPTYSKLLPVFRDGRGMNTTLTGQTVSQTDFETEWKIEDPGNTRDWCWIGKCFTIGTATTTSGQIGQPVPLQIAPKVDIGNAKILLGRKTLMTSRSRKNVRFNSSSKRRLATIPSSVQNVIIIIIH